MDRTCQGFDKEFTGPSVSGLFQFDSDSIRRLIGRILLDVYARRADPHVVGLPVRLIVQIEDHAVEDMLVVLTRLMGTVVDPATPGRIRCPIRL